MTREQVRAKASEFVRRPRRGQITWGLVITQAFLALFLAQCLAMGASWVVILIGSAFICSLGYCHVGGLAWTDDAVAFVRAFRRLPAEPPEGTAVAVAIAAPAAPQPAQT